jgi:drug/metabolite transporter (DMT)-like permease
VGECRPTSALYRLVVWSGLVCAVLSAVCYGISSILQAIAARAAASDRRGVDPGLVLRLVREWRYLCGLGLDLLGLVAQVVALRSLPLFLVQAAQAAAVPVTAVLTVKTLGARLSAAEWTSVGLVCAGLALLGGSARSQGVAATGIGLHWALLAATAALALLGALAALAPDRVRGLLLGLTSGLAFGAVGLAMRVVPSLAPTALLTDPAAYAVIVAGIVGSWLYATGLQRGGVVAATATNLIGETVPPALIGVLLLGDRARSGWVPVAVGGFLIALVGALVLARFGRIEGSADSPAAPVGVGHE